MDIKDYVDYTNYISFNVACGTLFSFSKSSEPQIIKYAKDDLEVYKSVGGEVSSTQCFDAFWNRFSDTGQFYFSFPAVPYWYNKVIEEFNNTFSHMKITSVFEKDILIYEDSHMGSHVHKLRFSPLDVEEEAIVKKVVFCLELDNKFYKSYYTRQRISYLIHHFFRLLSYAEKYYITLLDEDPGENYIEFVLNLSNRIVDNRDSISKNYHDMVYRSLAETQISKEDFLNLNYDIIDEAFGKDQNNRNKQTSLINTLKNTRFLNYKGKYFSVDKNQQFLLNFGKIEGLKSSVIRIDSVNLIQKLFNFSVFLMPTGAMPCEGILSNLNLLTYEITQEDAKELIEYERKNYLNNAGKFYSGKKDCGYYYTNEDSLLREVKNIEDYLVEVEILDHKTFAGSIGMTYTVRRDRLVEVKADDWKNSKIKKTIGQI